MLEAPRQRSVVSITLRTATRLLLPLLLLFSAFLFFRGHDAPGGGFTGGLVAASAFALYAIAYDVDSARRALRARPRSLAGVGLLTAIASGLMGVVLGDPFLTAHWWTLHILGTDIELGTPLLFELGVYLVVLGVTSMIVLSLAER